MTQSYGTVQIDGVEYPLGQGANVNENATDRFPGKVTFGEYQLDSNDLLSAKVWSNLSGGNGVTDLLEGVTDNRYSYGNIYTRHPGKWSKPFRITRAVLGSAASDVYPLGDMLNAGTRNLYLARNTSPPTLYQDTTSKGTITGVPVNRSVVFGGSAALPLLYIPQGTNGYSTYEPAGDTLTNTAGAELMVDFVLWDNKLIGLDTDGQLYYATTAAAVTTFTSYGTSGKLDEAYVPKRLEVYKNQQGEPAIHVVTDQNVWVFDPATPRLYAIPNLESVHPSFGAASCVWRDSLYVAAGMDILEYNGNVVRNIGLSRDDGLASFTYTPASVISLAPGQNAMYALVDGVPGAHVQSVHEYTGFGWHGIESRVGVTPVGMVVSRAGSGYNLVWGSSSGGYSKQALPADYTNPAQVATDAFGYAAGSGVSAFSTTYDLYTGYFTGNMEGYRKIASAIRVDFVRTDGDANFVIEYRKDAESSWTNLVTWAVADLPFGSGALVKEFGTADAQGVTPGVGFNKIQFHIGFTEGSNNPTGTHIIRSVVFSFLKLMNPSWSWTMTLDLSAPFNDRSPANMFADLVALKDDDRFYAFSFHTGETFRARIAGVSAGASVAGDFGRTAQVSLVEIRPDLGMQP